MAIERTLSILKPDALQSGVIGKILARFEDHVKKRAARLGFATSRRASDG